jgi:hypothetical protein
MRGFFIFLIFICKKNVWRMTKKRHPKLTYGLEWPLTFVREKVFGRIPDRVSISDEPNQLTERNTLVTKSSTKSRIETQETMM